MKIGMTIKTTGLAVMGLLVSLTSAVKAESLESLLKETGWDALMGTWVDASGNKTTFSWKYPGVVLQSITLSGDTERLSLIGKNPKTGDIYVYSSDNKGGSSQGTCEFTSESAVFNIKFLNHEGQSGAYEITYKLTDGNHMDVIVGGRPEPIKLTKE